MKLKLLFCLGLVSILSSVCYAQNAGKISGLIRDEQNKTIKGASITLHNLTDTTIKQTVASDENGAFRFNDLKNGAYSISVIFIGYQAYTGGLIRVDTANQPLALPVIVLQPAAMQTLKEVVITYKKPLIEQKIDRMIVNVDALLTASGGNAIDVLSKSPGVIIDANGGISLDGKNNILILIDGRPTYLSGQDLVAYLKSLPVGSLDKVELISNPPASYDASGGAVINIVLKKNHVSGFNGSVSLGYNQGIYARSNDALNINYRIEKFNIFSNLSYSHDQNYNNQTFARYFYNPDGSQNSAILQNSRYVYRSDSWNGRIGMDYFLSPKTTLGIMLTGNTRPKTDQLNYANDQYNGSMKPDSIGRGSTSGNYQSKNTGINLNMEHKFDNTGILLTADLDALHFNSNADQLSPLMVYLPDGSVAGSQQRVFLLPSNINIYSGKADYVQPLSGKAELDAGIKSSYVATDNQSDWFNQTISSLVPDYSQTNHFRYSENSNAVYVNLKKRWGRWAAQAGLRIENTIANGHQFSNPVIPDSAFTRRYTTLFPSFYLLYKLDTSGNNTLVLNYNERIHRPAYQQLNPFLFYQDQYTYTSGNPGLLPSVSHNFGLKYTFKQYFGVSLNYGFNNNQISPVTSAEGDIFITSPLNFIHNKTFGLVPYFSLTPVQWWTLHLNAVLLYILNNGSTDGITINQKTNVHEIETSNEFQLGKTWSAEVDGFFPGSQTFGQSSSSSIYNISGAVQKSILQGLGTITLNVNDIFHSMNIHSQTIGINQVSAYSTSETDTRRVGLSFIYHFGKAVNARKRNHNAGSAEDEKERTN